MGNCAQPLGNPFSPGGRAAAPLKQGRDAVDQARAIGARTPRERAHTSTPCRSCSRGSRRSISARGGTGISRRDGGGRRVEPVGHGGVNLSRAVNCCAALPTDKTTQTCSCRRHARKDHRYRSLTTSACSHYIIHSYDVPALADRACYGCEAVCQIAPAAPHALHMPSHTFTRVGAWQESIDTNIASAEVAKREGSDGRRAAHNGLPHLRVPADRTTPRGGSSRRCRR